MPLLRHWTWLWEKSPALTGFPIGYHLDSSPIPDRIEIEKEATQRGES